MVADSGAYRIVLNIPAGNLAFKFTRGSWGSVEGGINGNYIPNRTYYYDGTAKTLSLGILSWEDLGTVGNGGGTATSNVAVVSASFYMPQLNRYRKIWIYLPPDYYTTSKRFPVLYMQDGQNLFDKNTAAFGTEWEVDESLNALHEDGDYGCIVVGIDHGGSKRLDEYSPWVNVTYGGGEGSAYVEFLVNTLKPYIDGAYRTLPGRLTTGIMGSSMGGLISMFGFAERQDIFSRAGILSPSFWFGGTASMLHVLAHPRSGSGRVCLIAGGGEPASVALNMALIASALEDVGFSDGEIWEEVVPGGSQSEWFWAQEFPGAYLWLFQDVVVGASEIAQGMGLEVFPNPVSGELYISGLPSDSELAYTVLGMDGIVRQQGHVRAGEAIVLGSLPVGLYGLRVEAAAGRWYGRFVRG
jgi:predicted alpha/beta superfamily hydrolase